MKRLYREMVRLLEQSESFAVATIFDKVGSAPRSAGAKMVVRADGSIFGTIGGGRLEADAIRLAKEALRDRRTLVHKFDLTGKDVAAMDMICGGVGEALIEFFDANDRNNRIVCEAAAGVLDRGAKAWLITVLTEKPAAGGMARQQCLVGADKSLTGAVDCDPYMLEKLVAGPAKISLHADARDGQRFLVEALRPTGTLYLFGAGHLSQRIAPLSQSVGFRTVILDDRGDYASRARFAEPAEIAPIDSFNTLPALPIDENSYLVIVTRGHLYDRVVLQQVLRSKAAYIGMIGSRSKRDLVFRELISQGFGEADLARVHAPIGTNIGAETPEELAVSIVGELIQVRAKRENGERKASDSAAGACCRILAPNEQA
jgi:xanthine dehydrogenase accessory factor